MDIDFFKLEGGLIKESPMQGYIEGLILKINQKDFPEFCNREVYTQGNKLISHFFDHNSIGEALWDIFQDSLDNDYNQSIVEYRKNLKKKINYTSIHYIPHPLYLKDLGYAITFIAPGRYKTGNDFQQSRKEQEHINNLLNINDILKRNDVSKNQFLNYTLECLYGGVHGINIRDIIDFISHNPEFLSEIKNHLTKELIIEEKQKFVKNLFQNLDIYEQRFGNLKHNIRRSGLESILEINRKTYQD